MAKATKEEVNYRIAQERPGVAPERSCGLCEMFRRKGGKWDKCTDVEGDISPFFYCDIYAKRDDPELKQLPNAAPAQPNKPPGGIPY